MEKNLDKDVFHVIKTAIPELSWKKISHENFCKLTQITKKMDNFRQVVPPFEIKLK